MQIPVAARTRRTTLSTWLGSWQAWLLIYIVMHLPRLLTGPVGIDLRDYKQAADAVAAGQGAAIYVAGGRFIYSPLALVLMFPLHWLELRAGYVLLGLLNWAALFFLFRWLLGGLELGRGRALAVMALTLLAIERFFGHAVNIGQVDVLTALFLVRALVSTLEKRTVSAIGCYTLAIGFKLTPLVFLPYLLWARQWRLVVGTLAALLMLNVASAIAIAGGDWSGLLSAYVHRMRLLSQETWDANISLVAVAVRSGVSRPLILVFLAIAFLGFHGFMSRRMSPEPGASGPRLFARHAVWWGWLMTFQLVASPITWFTHLPLLVVPVIVCCDALLETPPRPGWILLFVLFLLHCWGMANRVFASVGVPVYPGKTILCLILILLVTLVASRLTGRQDRARQGLPDEGLQPRLL